ncbi:MAG: hypothetical protein QMC37_12325, partial [Flavobacteriales bacterium]
GLKPLVDNHTGFKGQSPLEGKLKMIQHLGFFTVYKLLGMMAVNVALVEEGCDASHAETFNRLNTVPTLEPFVVTMS